MGRWGDEVDEGDKGDENQTFEPLSFIVEPLSLKVLVFGVIGFGVTEEFIRRSLLEGFIVSIIMKNFQQLVKRKWILGFLGIVLFQNHDKSSKRTFD
ncbi:hypothetical protein IQ276_003755 [Desmonostoc muscorum LEGE 12446]|uniref:hypothetical protein n=1 Tax=Desmonostoc muscorum TaxID=1179 RepID=UPI001F3E7D91|nr:hypothetical protein [Desmonostoc muscorum]MCF2145583.1 hypothetical protein [Desmonostoc muscorum LEGE 12446]